jgi:hypothetical protein
MVPPQYQLEAFPWGSQSRNTVFFPCRARLAATVPETLVFPTPLLDVKTGFFHSAPLAGILTNILRICNRCYKDIFCISVKVNSGGALLFARSRLYLKQLGLWRKRLPPGDVPGRLFGRSGFRFPAGTASGSYYFAF